MLPLPLLPEPLRLPLRLVTPCFDSLDLVVAFNLLAPLPLVFDLVILVPADRMEDVFDFEVDFVDTIGFFLPPLPVFLVLLAPIGGVGFFLLLGDEFGLVFGFVVDGFGGCRCRCRCFGLD